MHSRQGKSTLARGSCREEFQWVLRVAISPKSLWLAQRVPAEDLPLNGPVTELLILKVSLQHGLIHFHRAPSEGKQLKSPQVIDRRNPSSDFALEAQRSTFGRSWPLACADVTVHIPAWLKSVFKSTLKNPKTGMQREGRASFFHFMQKCLCVKSR